jgi:hypothetical protein
MPLKSSQRYCSVRCSTEAMRKPNRVEIRGNIAVLFLRQKGAELECLIDVEDAIRVSAHTWQLYGGYVKSTHRLKLHRFIMNAPDGLDVDHIHHNKLDNRKSELRCVSRVVNSLNRISPKKVHRGRAGRWVVRFRCQGHPQYFGQYNSKEVAQAMADSLRERYRAGELVQGRAARIPISGVHGVYKYHSLWEVRPMVKGKLILIGRYRNKQEAIRARKQFERRRPK